MRTDDLHFTTKDPENNNFPAVTSLLYRVCGNDSIKFQEAVRIVDLFIAAARASVLSSPPFDQGDWDCEPSPIGKCVYTTDRDACIFCEQPEERK